MRLYLVQHGKAVEKEEKPERPLSSEGVEEVVRMGNFLKTSGVTLPTIWHSGKTRAEQTATEFARRLAPETNVQARQGLGPNDSPRAIAKELRHRDEDLMIVGHLPFLSRLASLLVAQDEDAVLVQFRFAGIVCLVRDADEKDLWEIAWYVRPELVR